MPEKITFLSYDQQSPWVDDNLTLPYFHEAGLKVETLPWKTFRPSPEDVVVLRSTWDYFHEPEAFLKKLSEIEGTATLYNSRSVVEWNYHKGYLKDLEQKGISIVPTHLFQPNSASLPSWKADKVVIKPAVSANSFETKVIRWEEALPYMQGLEAKDWMCQPFIPGIKDGETSLVFFNKQFSHGVVKVPKAGDFRVQEEFGGQFQTLEASPELIQLGEKILKAVPWPLLYARVDLVPHLGQMLLMELELIEPSLYFKHDPLAPKRFVNALTSLLNR